MDKEKARFILSCFRPDGADANDADFAEALKLAASDRQLGEWLAHERAQDAAFSEALMQSELPEELREEILAGIAAEQGVEPEVDELDSGMIGALAGVATPKGLRSEILEAMAQTAAPVEEAEAKVVKMSSQRGWWRFGLPLAAAAGIVFAVVVTQRGGDDAVSTDELANTGPDVHRVSTVDVQPGAAVPISHVEDMAISSLTSPDFSLDLKDPNQKKLFKHIREQGRVCPEGAIPPGLKKIPGIGCRKIEVDGKVGTIVCFQTGEGQVVHMVVFRRKDVHYCKTKCRGLDKHDAPVIEQHEDWSVARWHDRYRVFLLLEQGNSEKHLSELF